MVNRHRTHMRTELEPQEKKIIWQAHFLSREYLPEKVVGREEQRRRLEMCLSPMKEGQAPLNAWLYGPAGSGKTVLARTVARDICRDSSARFAFYVNCWERGSLYQVVQAIAESLKVLGADAQDTNVKLERIRQVIKQRPVVVILDDVDRVAPSERERIIYGLLNLPNAGLVCIANKKETFLALEERTRSRLSPVVIECPLYRDEELREILLERAKDALALGAWNEGVLSQLAHAAGSDARAALEALRHAAVAAESSGKKRIALSDCPDAARARGQTRHEEMLQKLSYHERLICELAMKNEPVLTAELRRVYGEHCQKNGIAPVARRTFSKYVKLMIDHRLLSVDPRIVVGKGRLLRTAAS